MNSAPVLKAQLPSQAAKQQALSEAKQLIQQVAQLYKKGLYSKAIPLAERSLSLSEQALGPHHSDIALNLSILALLHKSLGNNDQLQPLLERSLDVNEKALGLDHPEVATSLNNLAGLHTAQGSYTQAIPLLERALRIREQVLEAEHPDVAQSLNNLAATYQLQGRYDQALPILRRAIQIREKVLGPEHADVAESVNNLASVLEGQTKYAEAESLYKRSLQIREKALGPNHSEVAKSLNNLAGLYTAQGNYTQAEPLLKRSLHIKETVLSNNHPDVAESLNNLGALYWLQGNYSQSELFLKKSLQISEEAHGPNHPTIASILDNLAVLHSIKGDYAEAKPLHLRSLDIRETKLGSNHSLVAFTLNNMAMLEQDQGNYHQAEPLHQRSLRIREEVLGLEHPDVLQSVINLASLYKAQGDTKRAYEFLHRATKLEEQQLDLVFSIGSETRKQAYVKTLTGRTYGTVSFHLQGSPSHKPAALLALSTILRQKGRILSAQTDSFLNLRKNLGPAEQKLLDQLRASRSKYATLIFQGSNQLPTEQYQASLIKLKKNVEDLENKLALTSGQYRTEKQQVNVGTVQKQIPNGTALVEFIRYRPYNFQAIKQEKRWESPHYAAYILKSEGGPQWVDLGEAEPIDQTVAQFRQALTSSTSDVRPIARKLNQRLMQTIQAKLGNTRKLLLSPDSQLNLIPFAALVDENNQYLVENYDITYLSSGRDLLRLKPTIAKIKRKLQPPTIIANPDYQNPGEIIKTAISGKNRSSPDLNLKFGPLPGTQQEANLLKKLLPNSTVLTDTQATENALKQVKSPQILHIATHGFFLDVDREAELNPKALQDRAAISVIASPSAHPQNQKKSSENPLLRSGLALAGANLRRSGNEDGIFTALEATSLNLRGTQLVVLSACETGLGDVASGEGVYGLRRAFVMTGAESQVLSLWKVSDEGTKDLMVSYYQHLLGKEGRGEAMRNTQLDMLKNPKYQHPFYWAAFIPSGDWQPMN